MIGDSRCLIALDRNDHPDKTHCISGKEIPVIEIDSPSPFLLQMIQKNFLLSVEKRAHISVQHFLDRFIDRSMFKPIIVVTLT